MYNMKNKLIDVGKIILTAVMLVLLSLFLCVTLQFGPPSVEAIPYRIVPITKGGTGAVTAAAALTALGAESETHASEHASGGNDSVTISPSQTPLNEGYFVVGNKDNVGEATSEIPNLVIDIMTSTDMIVTGDFSADTDWTHTTGTPSGWTIASDVADCSGSQTVETDLVQTVAPLVNGITYQVIFTITEYTAGNVWVTLGTQDGSSRSSAATFTENITANGTSFTITGDSSFDGKIDNVIAIKDDTWSGLGKSADSSAAITQGAPVYLNSSNKWAYADADDTAPSKRAWGVAAGSTTGADEVLVVITYGALRNLTMYDASWTNNDLLYLSETPCCGDTTCSDGDCYGFTDTPTTTSTEVVQPLGIYLDDGTNEAWIDLSVDPVHGWATVP
jgi:hypothetical protein